MYDTATGKNFTPSNQEEFWWNYNNSLPIWISAAKQGLKVGVYNWAGSTVCFIQIFFEYYLGLLKQ